MIRTEKFTFTGSNGQQLDGRLEHPLYARPRAAALFAHCFTCTKQSHAATRIAKELASLGIAVLRFDFTGLGGSEGDFANAGFASNVEDLLAAATALTEAELPPALLVGHSLGGAAAIAAAGQMPSVKAVATIGAPFDTAHVFEHFGGSLERIEREGEAEVDIAGRPFRIARSFLEQGRNQPQGKRLADLDRALLILHAPADETVSIDDAGEIFRAARHPKSFVALDGADHLLSEAGDAEYAARLIAAWAGRYLPAAVPDRDALEGSVQVETAGGKFAQWVRTPTHEFLADEPESYGGSDHGPTPYDLLLAALGTCTSMTLKMYAERKGLALDNVRVELEHSRDHHLDCVDCEEGGEALQAIDLAIHLEGDLSADDREKLFEIAKKCPVYRTLTGDLHIHETLVD